MRNEDYMREYFGEPISIYTDADAINDGTLVDITSLNLKFEDKPINRMTGNLFWSKRPDYPMNDEQLAALFAECEDSDDDPINFDMQAFARDIAEKLKAITVKDRMHTLAPDLWLVENEVKGWTLMLPSDY
jgi:type I site-specific restriction endonuclease